MAQSLRGWLASLELEDLATVFEGNQVDLRDLPLLSDDDLKELGLALGPRRRLLKAISNLPSSDDVMDADAESRADMPAGTAERRQLTVLFCDLVGSTALSGALDPEDMRDLMRLYQDTVTDAVSRHGGYVANYLGDGVLAYFGWPRAHEDQAAQAIRAGLTAVRAVTDIVTVNGEKLAARAGIASGQVVVGDLEGEVARQAGAVSGETPNLAARLQALASPGEVVIGGQTRQLVGRQFELLALGPQALKGISSPVPVWRVSGEKIVESRFETRTVDLVDFVGRDHELGLLLERWRLARNGEGQAVLLSGEPGIGKSRLTAELRRRINRDDAIRLTYQCSPQYANSAFYPVIRQLQRAANIDVVDAPTTQLDKMETLVRGGREATRLLSGLMSLPAEERYGPLGLAPVARKQRTIQTLIDELLLLAEQKPVLFVFEDAHWIDPSSEELLTETIARVADSRILMLVTHRPEWKASWANQPRVTALSLSRIGRDQAAKIVTTIAGAAVGAEAIDRIVSRTDGIPLFIEELTKSLVESGLDPTNVDIPATLQASLSARLDRLQPSAKEVAQIGAVIGREFDHELLTAVSEATPQQYSEAIDNLLQSQLISRVGTGSGVRYGFKHALVQDVAYQSMLREKRRDLHLRIVNVLEARQQEFVEGQPELLAHHCEAAGQIDAAARYWLQAGQQAIAQSAGKEAVAQLRRGLAALQAQPTSKERVALELMLQTTIGPMLLAIDGWGSETAGDAYRRAQVLSQQVENPELAFSALWGNWLYTSVAGSTERSFELIGEMTDLVERQGNDDMMMQVHHAGWGTEIWLGHYDEALDHVRKGLELYDADRHADHAMRFGGHDPAVCGKCQGAMALWFSGRLDQARASVDDGIALARQLKHPPSIAHALMFGSLVNLYLRDDDEALRCARELNALAAEQSLGVHLTHGNIIVAELTAILQNASSTIAEITDMIRQPAMKGIRILLPHYLARLGRLQAWAGQLDQARETLDEAESVSLSLSHTMWQPEVHRLKGEVALAAGAAPQQVGETFRHAIEVARKQRNQIFELRAATSLARLLKIENQRHEAQGVLRKSYGLFSEGFDTPDLKDAKALLDDLS